MRTASEAVGYVPVCGLASIKTSVLHLGLTDVQMGYDVAVHGHILADHKPVDDENIIEDKNEKTSIVIQRNEKVRNSYLLSCSGY